MNAPQELLHSPPHSSTAMLRGRVFGRRLARIPPLTLNLLQFLHLSHATICHNLGFSTHSTERSALSFLPGPFPPSPPLPRTAREGEGREATSLGVCVQGGFPGPARPTWVPRDAHEFFQQPSLCCPRYLEVCFQLKQIQDGTPNGTKSKLQMHGKK